MIANTNADGKGKERKGGRKAEKEGKCEGWTETETRQAMKE